MSNSAQRYSGHGDRGVKGTGKRSNRNTNNRENKKNHVGVIRFNHDDIVRSEMVKQLVIAFEREGGYVS